MFARHVSMHLKPNTRAELSQTIQNEILPLLRKQHGFQDEIVFAASGSGTEVVAISLWGKREDAEAYHRGSYPEVVKALAKVLDGTPEVRTFEVVNSTLQKDRRGINPASKPSGVRPHLMLRQFSEPARVQACGRDRTPDHYELRTR